MVEHFDVGVPAVSSDIPQDREPREHPVRDGRVRRGEEERPAHDGAGAGAEGAAEQPELVGDIGRQDDDGLDERLGNGDQDAERAGQGAVEEAAEGGGQEPVQDLLREGNRHGHHGVRALHPLLQVRRQPQERKMHNDPLD